MTVREKMAKWMRVILKTVAAVALFVVVGVAVLLALLSLDHTRETTLPAPTGPFPVGRTISAWSDDTHIDPMAPQPGTKRELLAWIWYPAAPGHPPPAFDDYLPAAWRAAVERRNPALMTHFLTRDLSRVRTHSVKDAEVAPQQSPYPVILMRAGLAKLTTDYTTLAEDLASHGYVVVGFDAPYRTTVVVLPDGREIRRARENDADLVGGNQQEQLAHKLVQAWSADMAFALDQMGRMNTSDPSGRFVGRLDMERVGVFGHSLGGATALQFCHDDLRCKAGIDVDGAPLGNVITEGVTQPFMFLVGDHESDADRGEVEANFQSLYDRMPSDRRVSLRFRGANHYMFSDATASPLLMRGLRALGMVRLDARRQLAVTAHCIRTFFDVSLRGAPASELKNQALYPEIETVP